MPTIIVNPIPQNSNTTGSTAAVLTANGPSVSTAVYTWIKTTALDGSTVYIPCWK